MNDSRGLNKDETRKTIKVQIVNGLEIDNFKFSIYKAE